MEADGVETFDEAGQPEAGEEVRQAHTGDDGGDGGEQARYEYASAGIHMQDFGEQNKQGGRGDHCAEAEKAGCAEDLSASLFWNTLLDEGVERNEIHAARCAKRDNPKGDPDRADGEAQTNGGKHHSECADRDEPDFNRVF